MSKSFCKIYLKKTKNQKFEEDEILFEDSQAIHSIRNGTLELS